MQEKNDLSSTFSARFSLAVKQSSMKQKEIANALNITEQTVSRYKKGDRMPDSSELYRLASFFGVTMDWLFGGELSGSDSVWKDRALAAEKKLAKIGDALVHLSKANDVLTSIATGKE